MEKLISRLIDSHAGEHDIIREIIWQNKELFNEYDDLMNLLTRYDELIMNLSLIECKDGKESKASRLQVLNFHLIEILKEIDLLDRLREHLDCLVDTQNDETETFLRLREFYWITPNCFTENWIDCYEATIHWIRHFISNVIDEI